MDFTEKNWKNNIRTDLALETREMITEDEEQEISGVKLTVDKDGEWDITVTKVEVLDENGSKIMNKPIGNYITIESPSMKESDMDSHEEIIKATIEQISSIIKINKEDKILVVGLGNRYVTADALGPKVISELLVTRHLIEYVPDEIDESIGSVCAISPGVMGQTGIETVEIIEGVVKKVKPDLVIVIDALASRRTSRVNTTIQIADTGVHPGSGVGNKRKGLNKESLGVPVIAIGVPTVVDAATIVSDTIDYLIETIKEEADDNSAMMKLIKQIDDEEKYVLLREVLTPYVGDMFVTPKEVDSVINRLANIISNALNVAIHSGLDKKDINSYMY